jgi:drug/metabolite transporter (DMT)-like permease
VGSVSTDGSVWLRGVEGLRCWAWLLSSEELLSWRERLSPSAALSSYVELVAVVIALRRDNKSSSSRAWAGGGMLRGVMIARQRTVSTEAYSSVRWAWYEVGGQELA